MRKWLLRGAQEEGGGIGAAQAGCPSRWWCETSASVLPGVGSDVRPGRATTTRAAAISGFDPRSRESERSYNCTNICASVSRDPLGTYHLGPARRPPRRPPRRTRRATPCLGRGRAPRVEPKACRVAARQGVGLDPGPDPRNELSAIVGAERSPFTMSFRRSRSIISAVHLDHSGSRCSAAANAASQRELLVRPMGVVSGLLGPP